MKISDAFDLYKLDYIRLRRQSIRTEELHDLCRQKLIQFLGDLELKDLQMEHIRRWHDSLAKKMAPNTVRLYVLRLRVVLSYCKLRQIQCLDPRLIPVPKRVEPLPTFLTSAEVTTMINCATTVRAKFVISLLYASGIRLSELLAMDRGQIVEQRFSVRGKGGKVRLCFIDERTERYMKRYLARRRDSNPALLITRDTGKRMTATNVQLLVKLAAQRAGIEKHVTPHTLRHSFATDFLKNNGNMRYLSSMLGHSSMATTTMYTHVVDYDLEQQYREYHKI